MLLWPERAATVISKWIARVTQSKTWDAFRRKTCHSCFWHFSLSTLLKRHRLRHVGLSLQRRNQWWNWIQALFQFHSFVDAQTSISCFYVMRKDTSETKLNCRQNWVKLDSCVTYEQRPADMIRILCSPLHCQTDRQVPVTTRCAHP